MEISASEFKAHCLELLDRVRDHKQTIVITKRGKPVARLLPITDGPPQSILGSLSGLGRTNGDIVAPIEDLWELDAGT
ncbi:type II toxin-antitoxin system Phd/YefM family antitoxin [bacterium CPR1]|nr:type II toxin-antitoxin system Phd/YefM family antitoxin [bacterium CPR1]